MKQEYMLVSKKGYMVVLPKVDDGVKAGVGASVEEGVGVSLNTFVNGSDESFQGTCLKVFDTEMDLDTEDTFEEVVDDLRNVVNSRIPFDILDVII